MHLKLLPVHSKLADPMTLPPELAKVLPPDWALSQHQVDTYKALLDPDVDVVINTAMTGDGKSLASQLLMLVYGEPMVSLYPTNELLVDQACNLIKTGAAWNTSINYTQLFGAQLDTLQTAIENTKRPDIVENLLFNHTVVLSNPDIWHLILQFGYQKGNAPTQIAQRFYERFPLFIFDEFHLYDQPQIGAVLSGLLFMLAVRNDSYPLKTLLLSATPSNLFKTLFERAGFTHRIAEISGEYTYDHINPDEKRWRTILQPVNLQVHAAPRRDLGGIEAWMQATGLEQLLHFFATQIYVKAAIIVNSVATAQRLRQTLKEPLERIGKTVESCTGLDGRAIRDRARKADVLVGTATVDVGVDFQINYLIFEASDAGNFVQRLGRIGRHKHYMDENTGINIFEAFEAHALVPNFVYERIFVGHDQELALFQNDPNAVERPELNAAINIAFPDKQQFEPYLRTWGRFQPTRVIATLANNKYIKGSFEQTTNTLRQQYGAVFRTSIGKTANEMKAMQTAGKSELVREAMSFRGGSPFQCGVIVNLPESVMPSTVGYDLLWLIANTECTWIKQAEFEREAHNPQAFLKGHHIGFMRVDSILAERRLLKINLNRASADWMEQGFAQAIAGVHLDCEGVDSLNWINAELAKYKVAAWFAEGILPEELRQKLRLPGTFSLYHFDHQHNQGTIAFGRDALLLDCVAQQRKDLTPTTALWLL